MQRIDHTKHVEGMWKFYSYVFVPQWGRINEVSNNN
jgi:hypothetical protein